MSLHSTTDRFIEDIIKAAKESFAKSPRRQPGETLHVQISGSGGQKLANYAGLGSLAGTLLSPGIGPHIGAAVGADEGRRGSAAVGSVLGGSVGGLTFNALGNALHVNPAETQMLGRALGSMAGAHIGGESNPSMMDRLKGAAYTGAKTAAARFGIKEAFIGPLVGSIAGPALARAGVGALAKGAGGAALGGMAGKVLPHIGGGMGGMAFDAASSMAGGAIGNKLQPQGPTG